MKKINSIVMLVAAAAMAFVSCQKQENFAPEVSSEDVVLTFASEKPAFEDETKTEWTGSSIQWSAGDKIAIAYTVAGNWQNTSGDASGDAKLYKSDALGSATETAKFNVSVSFSGTTEGEHIFYGVYPAPSETGFADAPVATLTVPSIQTPGSASFDGDADLMTGVSVGEFTSRPAKKETISMKWTRLVAHANITLTALNGVTEGETISTITLTAQEGANLVGSQKVNIQTNEVTNNNNESNVIVLNGGNLAISATGDVEFWVCFLPETLTSLTVEVETNKATYTRVITGISKTFKQNARNVLSVKMNEATRVAKEVEESWVLVTSNEELTDGTYVLVVKNTNNSNLTGALDTSNGSSNAPSLNQSVKVVDNTLTGVGASVQFDMTVVEGGYKFAVAGQSTDYLYTTNANNGVRIGTNTNNVWILTPDDDMQYAYNFMCNATERYLGVYETNPDWRCYTSLTIANIKDRNSEIYLYKKQSSPVVPDTTPSITVEETLELTSAEAEGTISVTYKNLEALEAAAYSDAECTTESDWLAASWENDAISYVASANEGEERTAYIRIYALDSEANEYTKVITVTQAGKAAEGETEKTWSWEGGVKSDFTSLSGVSASGLGSDYAESNAPYRLKLDDTGDYFVVQVDGAVKTVSVGVKMVGGATTSYLDIQGSSDGTSFTSVEQLTISGKQSAVLGLTTSKSFDPSYRYVKFYFTKGSNVGVGPISITYITEDGVETPKPELQERNLAFSETEATATIGGGFTAPVLSGITDGVTYSSSNTAVATVNESTGEVTLVAAGETTITATAAEDATYAADEASYTLTVSPASSGGEGGDSSVAPTGSVLWSENWGSYTGTVAAYTFVGTSVYDENVAALTYEVDNSNDKIETTTASSVTSNNLFFYKTAASSWTVKGIKLHGASSVTLKYTINRTNIAVYYSVDDGSEIELCTSSSSGVNSQEITNLSGETISFRFNKTGTSQNCRIDDISLTAN